MSILFLSIFFYKLTGKLFEPVKSEHIWMPSSEQGHFEVQVFG